MELEQSRAELDEARDEAQTALKKKEEVNLLRNAANAAKRTALDACEKAEALAEKRLRRAEEAEEKLGDARGKLAEYAEHYGAALAAKRKYLELGEKLALMPTWQPVQQGRGEKQFDFYYRNSARPSLPSTPTARRARPSARTSSP